MRSTSFIARPLTVQILTGIVLVLFSVTFLRFMSLTFLEEAPHETFAAPPFDVESMTAFDRQLLEAEHEMNRAIRRLEWSRRKGKKAWCGHDEGHEGFRVARQNALHARLRLLRLQEEQRKATAVEHELRLRAEQFQEGDESLRNRLGLATAPISIMR